MCCLMEADEEIKFCQEQQQKYNWKQVNLTQPQFLGKVGVLNNISCGRQDGKGPSSLKKKITREK